MIFNRRSLGKKYTCECGCKFYDLGKEVPVCPKCGKVFEREEQEQNPESMLFVDEAAVDELADIEFSGEEVEEEEGVKIVSISEVEKEEEEEGDEYE